MALAQPFDQAAARKEGELTAVQLYAKTDPTDAQLFAFLGGVVPEQPPALTPFERRQGMAEPPPPAPLDVRAQAPIYRRPVGGAAARRPGDRRLQPSRRRARIHRRGAAGAACHDAGCVPVGGHGDIAAPDGGHEVGGQPWCPRASGWRPPITAPASIKFGGEGSR